MRLTVSEQFDSALGKYEEELDGIMRDITSIHPEEREEYLSTLEHMAGELSSMEDYLSDEQYQKSEELQDLIKKASEAEYDGPSIHKYDDPYASRGLRRSDFY